jgi:hypothetical protein
MFVSRTTRSSRLPNLARGAGYFLVDASLVEIACRRDAAAAAEKRIEAALPLVRGDRSHALGVEPGVDRLADESGDRTALPVAEEAQQPELIVVEVDVRAAHPIHHTSTLS